MSDAEAPRPLLPLCLVAAATLGVEIALTRFFAVAGWSEYGWWVISIAMTGFAVSGVVAALAHDWLLRHADRLLRGLPVAMLLAGAAGWIGVAANGFNPLELQNGVTAGAQLTNILLYYVASLPFFGLAGFAISLYFIVNSGRVGRVYGFDLLGAAAGALAALALMWVLHPFALIPLLLPLLALAAIATPGRRQVAWALGALVLAEGAVLLLARPVVSEWKPIYAPMNVPDSRVLAERREPRGVYQLLDNFTERPDIDLSNNAGGMGLPAPPRAFGLYRDGIRIAAMPAGPIEAGYAPASLDAAAYALLDRPSVLLIGTNGGFRIAEARALGARAVTAIEPEPGLRRMLADGFGPVPPLAGKVIDGAHPLSATAARHMLIDLATDPLDGATQARHLYTEEALGGFLARLEPGGLLSISVSIRELPAYATRLIATGVAALRPWGDPAPRLAVLRSAWTVRILLSPTPLSPARVAALVAFAEARSFDISHAPGLPMNRPIWNDLPAVALGSGTVAVAEGASDAIAEEVAAILAGTPRDDGFERASLTRDRPHLSPILRPAGLWAGLDRLDALPQAELGPLVNLAVLAQAVPLAVGVLLLPLLGRRVAGARSVAGQARGRGDLLRAACYFACLGLGFLFIEIHLIEHAALLLDDRAAGFSLVLATMLTGAGLGSLLAGRRARRAPTLLTIAVAVILLLCAAAWQFGYALLIELLPWPTPARAAALILAITPAAVALGMPFPLGLDRVRAGAPALLPWAWAVNGAFSVIATPLAAMIVQTAGAQWLLAAGVVCYGATILLLPRGAPP